eukprot:TRINITY_DN318_c1_g1_i1.p1 TRINITY_DN318_c1_g1~~TRINITY_DN318_c1_g1_i1.p1  ORF type:complete len:226 (+),score=62.03 TRINITY_DN318_c1_g1_i1:49-726(+)
MQASVRDEHIQREIWNGAVPIEINLAKNESLGCKSTPEAYYLLAQRNGYLALLSDEIKQHFLQFFNEGDIDDDIVWFSYGDAPLKWHFPTGVLFDMFDRQQDIPWKIEAHFKNFPSDQIIDYSLTEALKSHYMNNLKEANYLKGGANSKINLLSKEEQNNLWDGLKESNYDKFWGTHQILSLETKDLRYVPIRILTHDKKIIQDPIYAYNGQGKLFFKNIFLHLN